MRSRNLLSNARQAEPENPPVLWIPIHQFIQCSLEFFLVTFSIHSQDTTFSAMLIKPLPAFDCAWIPPQLELNHYE